MKSLHFLRNQEMVFLCMVQWDSDFMELMFLLEAKNEEQAKKTYRR